jgi:hypothetical protein
MQKIEIKSPPDELSDGLADKYHLGPLAAALRNKKTKNKKTFFFFSSRTAVSYIESSFISRHRAGVAVDAWYVQPFLPASPSFPSPSLPLQARSFLPRSFPLPKLHFPAYVLESSCRISPG